MGGPGSEGRGYGDRGWMSPTRRFILDEHWGLGEVRTIAGGVGSEGVAVGARERRSRAGGRGL